MATESFGKELLLWAKDQGATVHPHLDLFAIGSFGARGIVTTAPIPAGETLLRIPGSLTIQPTLELQPDGPLRDFFRGLDRPLSNVVKVTLIVLHELRVKKTDSRWWPYLRFLDETVHPDVVAEWHADQRALLEGTVALLRLPPTNSDNVPPPEVFETLFQREVLPVMDAGGDLWPVDLRQPEFFLRCLSWVMSRAFWGSLSYACDGSCIPSLESGVGDGKAQGPFMFPLFDQVNHSSWKDKRSAHLVFNAGDFVITAERDLEIGEEVLHSYGDHSDPELLRTYGFVESDQRGNPHNSVLVVRSTVLEACGKVLGGVQPDSERIALLEARTLLQPVYKVARDGVLPASLLTVVQVLLMNTKEFAEYASSDLQVLGKEFLTSGSDFSHRVAAAAMMILALTKSRYDKSVLGADATRRQSLAEKARASEFAVLKAAQEYILTVLAPSKPRGAGKVGTKRARAKKAAPAAAKRAREESKDGKAESDSGPES